MAGGASARRHAHAVFQIALEKDTLDKWQEDLDALATAFEDPEIKTLFENPKVRPDRKLELAGQIPGLGPLAVNLASLLITKGRVRIAAGIAAEYRSLLNAHRGLETAEVTTAVPLDDQSKSNIVDRMSEVTGKKIVLTSTIEPEIIGGLVIKIGDNLIDGSTRARLEEMRKALVEQRS